MNNDEAEQRKHRRLGISLVAAERDEGDQIPVWVFKEEPEADGPFERRSGFILNVSEGGMQVLTSAEEPLVAERYEIQLLVGEKTVSAGVGVARRVWSRPVSKLGNVNGFEYEVRSAATQEFMARHGSSVANPQNLMPCLLIAV